MHGVLASEPQPNPAQVVHFRLCVPAPRAPCARTCCLLFGMMALLSVATLVMTALLPVIAFDKWCEMATTALPPPVIALDK
eukprot:scaffold226518_cov22-Tisochrysis_lutea.AAC.3